MNAAIEELAAAVAGPEAERQLRSTQAEVEYPWQRFLREREWSETPRTAPRRWRDEEGL